MGCTGSICIHPDQVEVINTCFQPTEADYDAARAVVEAWEHRAPGSAVISFNGRMIDRPVVRHAQNLLAQQKAP